MSNLKLSPGTLALIHATIGYDSTDFDNFQLSTDYATHLTFQKDEN